MDSYHFWQDFFQTFRASSDFIKAMWIVVPSFTLLGLTWIVLISRFRRVMCVDTTPTLVCCATSLSPTK
ncbi:MAG: hypothetical protein M9924_03010 [Rhizobiaceae bacterium]|nr:hypothetical protein [Rhizobiaceae bacterium]